MSKGAKTYLRGNQGTLPHCGVGILPARYKNQAQVKLKQESSKREKNAHRKTVSIIVIQTGFFGPEHATKTKINAHSKLWQDIPIGWVYGESEPEQVFDVAEGKV